MHKQLASAHCRGQTMIAAASSPVNIGSSRMNNTALGNSSLLLFCDDLGKLNALPNFFCLAVRLPANIYILQLIISQHLITAEFYTLNEAIFEIFIFYYDVLGATVVGGTFIPVIWFGTMLHSA
ncbi:unnamed protein product [Pleuronectes platessa]|uniref:Uncharacterized protein n=1 Tax=Pleuronectes platessa TaxID=8262 RepID=A0A9N7Z1A0_PLEPL|nr:unnamed protein product [Pleuronectes platessa]